MRPPHWLPGIDARTQAALDFIDQRIAAGIWTDGYGEIAEHLSTRFGPTNRNQVAGLLDTHAARETAEWWRQQIEVEQAAA